MLRTSIKGYKGSPRIKRAAVLFNTHGFIDARHAMLAVGYTPEESRVKEKRRTIHPPPPPPHPIWMWKI